MLEKVANTIVPNSVVEVGDHEVAVGEVEVQRRAGEQHTGQTAEEERHNEAHGPQHRRLEGHLALPHGADPLKNFRAGRDRDEEGHEREERQQNGAGHEHVVRPTPPPTVRRSTASRGRVRCSRTAACARTPGNTSDTMPKNGRAMTYTSGWPKNQNMCCHRGSHRRWRGRKVCTEGAVDLDAEQRGGQQRKISRIRTLVTRMFHVKIGIGTSSCRVRADTRPS